MKSIYFILGGLCLLGTFTSCEEQPKGQLLMQETEPTPEKHTRVDLKSYGYAISIKIPDTVGKVMQITEQEYGLQIYVDARYNIGVGYDGDLELKKQELKGDALYTNEIIEEASNFIIYKSTLPDGSKTFYHFYGVKLVDQEKYEFYDITGENPNSEKTIRAMVGYLRD